MGARRPARAVGKRIGGPEHHVGYPSLALAQRSDLLLGDQLVTVVEDGPQRSVRVAFDLPDVRWDALASTQDDHPPVIRLVGYRSSLFREYRFDTGRSMDPNHRSA
jgi:hypothetical protein